MPPASAKDADRQRGSGAAPVSPGPLVVLVGIGLFAFYVAIQRGAMVGWDGRIMASVAKDLWQHGRLQVNDAFGVPITKGAWSKYGIGNSLLMAPLWGLQPRAGIDGSVWITLVNPLVLAVAGAVICCIGIELGWRRTTAVATAVGFGLLTMAPQYSTELFAEPGVVLGTVVTLLGVLWWQKGRAVGPWLVGFGIGSAVLFRPDSMFLVGAILLAVPVFVPLRRLATRWVQWFVALAAPILAAGLWTAYYNNLRCGSPLCNTYRGEGFTFPLPSGLYRILLSPGKGFVWYNLILLMALPGFVFLWRRHRALTLTVLALSVLRILVYAKWHDPDGSVAWGPRFLLPLCALLALPAGELWQCLLARHRVSRAFGVFGVGILILASAVVTVASVWVGYEQDLNTLGDLRGVKPSQYAAVEAQRVHAYFNSVRGSNIVRNVDLLSRAKPFPLLHFRGGPSALGVGALGVSGTAFLAATLIARRVGRPIAGSYRPRHSRHASARALPPDAVAAVTDGQR